MSTTGGKSSATGSGLEDHEGGRDKSQGNRLGNMISTNPRDRNAGAVVHLANFQTPGTSDDAGNAGRGILNFKITYK
jgi:hypothetical protein